MNSTYLIRKVSLPDEVYDVLCMFGDLDDVVDRILTLYEEEAIPVDVERLPKYADHQDSRHKIKIYNRWYEEMLEYYGSSSTKYSLRRMLCYFVYEELYEEYDMTVTQHSDKLGESLAKLEKISNEVVKCEIHSTVTIPKKLLNELTRIVTKIRGAYNEQIQQTHQS